MITGSCLCGAVTITVPALPPELKSCNCSACRRYGALWAYYPRDQVTLSGETTGFERSDMGEPAMIAFHHCPTCHCFTHWQDVRPEPESRMGINARLMPPECVAGLRIRRFDGADTWTDLDDD